MKNTASKKDKFQDLVDLILKNANTINELKEAVRKARAAKDKQAYEQAHKVWSDSYSNLAFPGGLGQGLNQLDKNDPDAVNAAIAFLVADPLFFRSGYIKEMIARKLKKLPLTHKQIEQVQDFLIAAVQRDTHREFREYCRLAAQVPDDAFAKRVQEIIATSGNAQHAKHAQWLYDYIKGDSKK